MPRRWFTNDGAWDWNPSKGYNELFAQQVRYIREWFDLTRHKPGTEFSTGTWRKYILRGDTVYITVDRFTWMEYRDVSGGVSPVFHLNIRIAKQTRLAVTLIDKIMGKSHEEGGLRIFFEGVVTIEFPTEYPAKPPRFRVEDRRHTSASGASHDHHRFRGGWMCILADYNDWDSRRDTIISGLNAAFDWIVWHFKKFGW